MRAKKKHYAVWFTAIILALYWPYGTIANADTNSHAIYEDKDYRITFDDFYSRLGNLPGDVLVDVMEEQIETALLRGRNIAPVDLQHKIRQIELAVHKEMRHKLCPFQTGRWSQVDIELAGLEGVAATLSGYRKHNDDYARIVSVLVRILEGSQGRFCNSTDFRDLAP